MEKITGKHVINEAGTAGLLFGAISGGFCFLSASTLTSILSVVKLVGLIFLMTALMKRLCRTYSGVTSRDTRRFGTWTAFFSALITALCSYIAAKYVHPEVFREAMDTVIQSGMMKLSADEMAQMDEITGNLPVYMLAANIIYCFLYGWILSLILSAGIPGSNPFKEGKSSSEGASDDDII